MSDLWNTPPDVTPIDPDAAAGLIPPLTRKRELDEFEAANITEAADWAQRTRSPLLRRGFPSPEGLRELHRRMFSRTWRWAGTYRRTDTNIGVPWQQIVVAVRQLCDDVNHRIDHDEPDGDLLTAEFHHRLVSIHPFPNGNGRHARLAADVLRHNRGLPPWRWGSGNLGATGDARTRYIATLRAADAGNIQPLMDFCRG